MINERNELNVSMDDGAYMQARMVGRNEVETQGEKRIVRANTMTNDELK